MRRPYPIIFVLFLTLVLSNDNSDSDILEFTNTQNQLCKEIENFDITDSQRQSIFDSIYSEQNQELSSQVEKWINNSYKISSDNYFIDLQYYTLPWLIIAISTLFLSMLYILVTLMPSSIIKWIKQHTEDEFILNTKRFHKFGIVTIVILNLLIIIVSIISLVYSNKAIDGLDYSNCYIAKSFNKLLVRNDENFTGYSILQADFNSLQNNFMDFQSNLKKLYQSRVSITLQSKQQDIIDFNDQLKRNEPNSPLPIKISSNGTHIISAIESYFSKMKIIDYLFSTKEDENHLTQLGYYDIVKKEQNNMYLTSQVDEIKDYYGNIFQRFGSLENSSLTLRDSKLTTMITKTKQQLSQINNYILHYANKLIDFHQTLSEDMNYYFNSNIGLLIVLIIFSFIEIILWLGYMINKHLKIKKYIDILWFLCNLILVGILIINIFLQSNSKISNELCIYFDSIIHNEQFYDQQNIIDFSETKEAIHSCLYGDGNIYEQLNFISRLKDIRTFINSENGVLDEIQKLNSNQAIFIQKLNNNSLTITSIVDGTFIDLSPSEMEKFQILIDDFNQYKEQENCVELSATLCSDGSYPRRNGGLNDSQMCWHPSYLITKYSSSCLNQQDLFQKLKLHYQSQAQGWIKTQLLESQFVSQNLDLNFKLNQYINNHSEFIDLQQKTLYNLNSLLKATNCTFIKEDFNKMLDGMCVVYSYYLNKISILTIIIISALFLSILFNCLTSLKVSQMETYEEYASTKVINFAGSSRLSRLRASIEINQIMQNESPMNVNSTQQEFK
ncbi:unnamed protein product [Paramecium sonneborni]|uniref:Transmembrane protein n=1 Tax=Paramecium sonneborni TaxID=65129 RepID=A0A8S1R2Q6_9CILI|nr:unnamed protein product [Paramecium sonneborni]